MTLTANYNQALNQISEICDRVIAKNNFVILERGDLENVAVISAKELSRKPMPSPIPKPVPTPSNQS